MCECELCGCMYMNAFLKVDYICMFCGCVGVSLYVSVLCYYECDYVCDYVYVSI